MLAFSLHQKYIGLQYSASLTHFHWSHRIGIELSSIGKFKIVDKKKHWRLDHSQWSAFEHLNSNRYRSGNVQCTTYQHRLHVRHHFLCSLATHRQILIVIMINADIFAHTLPLCAACCLFHSATCVNLYSKCYCCNCHRSNCCIWFAHCNICYEIHSKRLGIWWNIIRYFKMV